MGDGYDGFATAPSGTLIGATVGTFPSVDGVTSEVSATANGNTPSCGVGVANCYSLQINTNAFSTLTPYTGGITATGWEQFVYEDTGSSASIYIEDTLFNYITSSSGSCPSPSPPGFGTWGTYSTGSSTYPEACYANSNSMSVPAVPVTDLANVTFSAFANYSGSGQDVVEFCVVGTPCVSNPAADNVLNLSQSWNVEDFNFFGENSGGGSTFNAGAAIEDESQLLTGSAAPIGPTCGSPPAIVTVESNNLFLWPCNAISDGIIFWEANQSFGLLPTQSSETVQAGEAASYSIQFTSPVGTFAPVQLTVSGLPAGATSSFPVTATPPFAVPLTVYTSPATPLGDYTLTVQSQIAAFVGNPNPGPIATTTISLHVFNFTVSISPASETVVRGLSATYAIQLSLDPGSTVVGLPPIVLADPGLPGDASTSGFNPFGYALSSIPTTVPFVVYTAPAPTGSLGDFPFTITATASGYPAYPAGAASASAALHIFDFTVGLSPAAESLPQGASTTMTVSVGLVPGSTTVGLPGVSLILTGVPSGVTVVGFPASLSIGSSQAFTLETSTVGGYVSCPAVSPHGGQDLRNANLAHCDLAGYNLRWDDLRNANLSGADLQNADLFGDDLAGANLASANTSGTNFQGDDLRGVDLTAAGPMGVFVLKAIGTTDGVSRSGSSTLTVLGDQLSGDCFLGDDLTNANLTNDVAVGTNFGLDNLLGADLAGADLLDANFGWDNLLFADLAGVNAQGANFGWDNLAFADLAGADLQGASFQGANLVKADLAGALLTGLGPSFGQQTNFNWANLEGAVLTGAICGSPNYITAFGANTHGLVGVPAACNPPLDPAPGFGHAKSPVSFLHAILGGRTELASPPGARTALSEPGLGNLKAAGTAGATFLLALGALGLYLGLAGAAIAGAVLAARRVPVGRRRAP